MPIPVGSKISYLSAPKQLGTQQVQGNPAWERQEVGSTIPAYYNPSTGEWATLAGRGQWNISATKPEQFPQEDTSDWLSNLADVGGAALKGWGLGLGIGSLGMLAAGGASALFAGGEAAGAGAAGAGAATAMPPAVIDTAGVAGMTTTGAAAAGGAATLMPPAVAETGATLSGFPSAATTASGLDLSMLGDDFSGVAGFGGEGFGSQGFSVGGGPIDTSGFGSSFDAGGMGYAPEESWSDWWKRMSGGGTLKGFANSPLRGALGVGSGLYGLYQANEMRKLSSQAMERSDPFGPERAQYAQRLRELYADPSQVERLPGYKAGLNAVERKMAAQGYNNSGNMMIALHDYGGRAFDSEAARLATLSGAAMQPDARAAIMARQGEMDLTSRSLGSLAFGAASF